MSLECLFDFSCAAAPDTQRNGRFRSLVLLTVQIYCSGNNPGIQSLASLAGKLSRNGARWVSDFSAPIASSSAVTFRA